MNITTLGTAGVVKMHDLVWFADSGHAWLQVKKADCVALGIADKITPYSYHKGEYAYLEEDLDAGLYIDAASKAGHAVCTQENYTDGDSVVRNYPHITEKTFKSI